MQSSAAGLKLSPLMDLNFSCELEMIPLGLDVVAAADLLPASTKALTLVVCALLLAWSHTRQSSVPGERPTHTAVFFHSAMQSKTILTDAWCELMFYCCRSVFLSGFRPSALLPEVPLHWYWHSNQLLQQEVWRHSQSLGQWRGDANT